MELVVFVFIFFFSGLYGMLVLKELESKIAGFNTLEHTTQTLDELVVIPDKSRIIINVFTYSNRNYEVFATACIRIKHEPNTSQIRIKHLAIQGLFHGLTAINRPFIIC